MTGRRRNAVGVTGKFLRFVARPRRFSFFDRRERPGALSGKSAPRVETERAFYHCRVCRRRTGKMQRLAGRALRFGEIAKNRRRGFSSFGEFPRAASNAIRNDAEFPLRAFSTR